MTTQPSQPGGEASSSRRPAPFWGVGPRIGLVTAIHFAIAVLLDHLLAPAAPWLRFDRLPQTVARLAAAVLVIIGMALYLVTVLALRRARRRNDLITTGPYRIVRHPLYAIGLFLLAPGVCLLFRSWLVMTTPLAMAAAIAWFIPMEEAKLEAMFGQAYRDYRQRTGVVLPRLRVAPSR